MKAFLIFITALAISVSPAFAADKAVKSPQGFDCKQKKNSNRIECKQAPKSDVKPEVKKPKKVDRKAPASVQKKAKENTK